VTAALAVGALLGALCCVPAPTASAQGLRISVFGDSVLLGAAEEITATLAGNDVSVDAHENVSLLGSLGTLEAARPAIGDVVVLDLGYNDGADLASWRDRIDRAMAILDGVPKVIWIAQRDFAAGRAEMNAELAAAAQRYPNLEVADWNTVVAANPGFVYGDGIHLTPAGQAGMADLVRSRVDAYVAARIAATSTTTSTTTTSTTTTTVAPPRSDSETAQPRRAASQADDGSSIDDLWWIVVVIAAVVLAVAVTLRLRSRPRTRGR